MDNPQRGNSSLDHVHVNVNVNSRKDDALPNTVFVCLFIQRVFNFMIEKCMSIHTKFVLQIIDNYVNALSYANMFDCCLFTFQKADQ